jgi:hypothetical protein
MQANKKGTAKERESAGEGITVGSDSDSRKKLKRCAQMLRSEVSTPVRGFRVYLFHIST